MNIVGVQYIGTKPHKTDNVLGTSAVWKPEEVINFDGESAKAFAQYSSVFKVVESDPKGLIYTLKGKGNASQDVDALPFTNLDDMDKTSLLTFARYHFNVTLDGDGDEESLRADIGQLMKINTLNDAQAVSEDNALVDGGGVISLQVNEEEYQAYLHGVYELKLVPIEADGDDLETEIETETETETESEAEAEAEQGESDEAEQTLPELLDSLDKKDLIELANENKLDIPAAVKRTTNLKKIREFILAELEDK